MDIPDNMEEIRKMYQDVVAKNTNVQTLLEDMNTKKTSLSEMYRQLLKENSSIISTLDMFNFQIKLMSNDLSYISSKYILVSNRMYCQYYKLFRNIQEYISKQIPAIQLEPALSSNYPTYDDTNPTKVYDFNVISDMHSTICELLSQIIQYLNERNAKYIEYKKINDSGVHIDIFIETFKHSVITVIYKMRLFSNTLQFYNSINVSNYTKLISYIEYVTTDVCGEISFPVVIASVKAPEQEGQGEKDKEREKERDRTATATTTSSDSEDSSPPSSPSSPEPSLGHGHSHDNAHAHEAIDDISVVNLTNYFNSIQRNLPGSVPL